MSCDDSCALYLALSDPANPTSKEKILTRSSWTSFRNFYYPENRYSNLTNPENNNIGSIFSKWIPLVGGQKYYF